MGFPHSSVGKDSVSSIVLPHMAIFKPLRVASWQPVWSFFVSLASLKTWSSQSPSSGGSTQHHVHSSLGQTFQSVILKH